LLKQKNFKFPLAHSLFSVYSVLTEMSEATLQLSPVQQKFILHWGEMGTRWGINRTVAQIHALLYIWPKPLNAEQITLTLEVARSNVSNSLRELTGWGIVKNVQMMGDRRDHFETLDDAWEMFRIIIDERKRREMDPTLELLRDCLEEQKKARTKDAHTEERLEGLHEFLESASNCYARVAKLPTSTLRKLSRMGDKVLKLLPI
jgi:DNA-binding transcriptional regulator GbsR (MarR family)